MIGFLERSVIFFGEMHGQDSNVLSMYRDEPDLVSVEVSMGSLGAYIKLTGSPRIGDLNPSSLSSVIFLLRLSWVPVNTF